MYQFIRFADYRVEIFKALELKGSPNAALFRRMISLWGILQVLDRVVA